MAIQMDFRVKNGLVVATTATILGTTSSTSTTTGALIVSGGTAISENLNVFGNATVGTSTKSSLLTVNNTVTSAINVRSNAAFISPNSVNTITVRMLNSDVLTFNGASGQLFSISDSFTGTIFAVNDISGVPSIEVYDTGLVSLAEFTGNVGIGTTSTTAKLTVNGGASISGITTITNTSNAISTTTGALQIIGGAGIGRDVWIGGSLNVAGGITASVSGVITTASTVNTLLQTSTATHFLTFVDSNNSGATAESLYTTSSFVINPGTGNVGIGTTPTTSKLEVAGNVRITGITTVTDTTNATSTTTGALQVVGGAGIGRDLWVGGNINVAGVVTGAISQVQTTAQTSTASYYLTFVDTNNSSAAAESLFTTSSFTVIPSSGNVGIGTNDPQRKLTVRSDSVGTVTVIALYNADTTNGNGSVVSFRANTTGTSSATFHEVAGFQIATTEHNHLTRNTNFSIFTDSSSTGLTSKVTITGDGKVGINTASPTSTLTVSGTVSINSDTVVTGGSLQVRNGIPIYLWNSDTTNYYYLDNTGASGSTNGKLRFLQGNVGTRVIFDSDGNVGIGTSSPTFKVDVALGSVNNNSTSFGYNVYADATTNVGYAGYSFTLTNSTSTATGFIRLARTASTVYLGMEIQSQSRDGIRFLTGATTPTEAARISAAGIVTITSTTNATSTTTGALQVTGGVGIGGNLYVGNSATILSTIASTGSVQQNALYVAGGVGIGSSLYVTGPAVFNNNVTFSGTSTYVYSTNTVYTDNLINIHSPAGSTGTNHTWTVNDGKDIGFIFHYYDTADRDGFLGLANDTKYLEWYDRGAESTTGTFTASNYGIFKTGGIQLVNTTASSSTSTGALTVAGGVGIGGDLYARNIYTNGSQVIPFKMEEFTATGSQTTFTVTGGYIAGTVMVFANGIFLNSGDFTASNGTTVVLNSARNAGDIIKIIAGGTSSSSNQQQSFSIAMSVALGM